MKQRSTQRADHVVSDATDGGAFKCLHCKARMKVELPVSLTDFADAASAFLDRHASCTPAEDDAANSST